MPDVRRAADDIALRRKELHLLLADRPLPYPIEQTAGATKNISVCFWYKHIREPKTTFSTIVILPHSQIKHVSVFRAIEVVAELLAEELGRSGSLAEFYEFLVRSQRDPFLNERAVKPDVPSSIG
jgi:hypothetical protein